MTSGGCAHCVAIPRASKKVNPCPDESPRAANAPARIKHAMATMTVNIATSTGSNRPLRSRRGWSCSQSWNARPMCSAGERLSSSGHAGRMSLLICHRAWYGTRLFRPRLLPCGPPYPRT